MPKRQATKRIETVEVQGEDSYAVLRRIDVGEAKAMYAKSQRPAVDLQAGVAKAIERYDVTSDMSTSGSELRRKLGELLDAVRAQPSDDSDLAVSLTLLASHVTEWNWVDDDGNPLPLPKDQPEIVDVLTDAEVRVLSNALQGPDGATGKG